MPTAWPRSRDATNAKDIDLLIPEQLHGVSADGALTIVDYDAQPNSSRESDPRGGRRAS